MSELVKFDSVGDYNAFNNHQTLHPLIGLVDLSKANPRVSIRMSMGIYCVILKDVDCGDLRYGRHKYDYQEGTLLFFGPGQVVSQENEGKLYQPKGYALVFHPDLLLGTSLNQHIRDYTFFSYQVNEGLHLSSREREIMLECFAKIEFELGQAIDNHSKKLIVSNL